MKKNIAIAVAAIAVSGGLAAYFFLQSAPPKPEPVPVQAPPAPPAPAVRQVIEPPSAPVALPALAESDSLMLDALAGLVGNKTLMQIFQTERIIRNIVATVDNLPRRRAPANVLPVMPAAGQFLTKGKEGNLTIDPKNAVRYSPYVNIAQAIDAKKLVGLYVRLYPLFQQAYEELGYPKQYFNDRLVEALDDLLAAPDVKEPISLVQPGVYYQFAYPAFEERSIGQRVLMRIGRNNATIVKNRLREIRQELKLHMREKKVEGVK